MNIQIDGWCKKDTAPLIANALESVLAVNLAKSVYQLTMAYGALW